LYYTIVAIQQDNRVLGNIGKTTFASSFRSEVIKRALTVGAGDGPSSSSPFDDDFDGPDDAAPTDMHFSTSKLVRNQAY
jgi:hypothetical protein